MDREKTGKNAKHISMELTADGARVTNLSLRGSRLILTIEAELAASELKAVPNEDASATQPIPFLPECPDECADIETPGTGFAMPSLGPVIQEEEPPAMPAAAKEERADDTEFVNRAPSVRLAPPALSGEEDVMGGLAKEEKSRQSAPAAVPPPMDFAPPPLAPAPAPVPAPKPMPAPALSPARDIKPGESARLVRGESALQSKQPKIIMLEPNAPEAQPAEAAPEFAPATAPAAPRFGDAGPAPLLALDDSPLSFSPEPAPAPAPKAAPIPMSAAAGELSAELEFAPSFQGEPQWEQPAKPAKAAVKPVPAPILESDRGDATEELSFSLDSSPATAPAPAKAEQENAWTKKADKPPMPAPSFETAQGSGGSWDKPSAFKPSASGRLDIATTPPAQPEPSSAWELGTPALAMPAGEAQESAWNASGSSLQAMPSLEPVRELTETWETSQSIKPVLASMPSRPKPEPAPVMESRPDGDWEVGPSAMAEESIAVGGDRHGEPQPAMSFGTVPELAPVPPPAPARSQAPSSAPGLKPRPAETPAPSQPAPSGDRKTSDAGGTTVLIRYTCPKCKTQGMPAVDKVGTVVNCSNCGKAMRLVMKK